LVIGKPGEGIVEEHKSDKGRSFSKIDVEPFVTVLGIPEDGTFPSGRVLLSRAALFKKNTIS
jgi:hypothetical protein